ncbi:MAG TPA: TonB-dependent receptor [Mucilaginibacter sp.]|nr:TonB-dependent receptor [Mucilaginibacter sp.]
MKKYLFIVLLFLAGQALAQQHVVTGTVTGKDLGTPIAGVTVKSSAATTSTDDKGRFSINANLGEILSFSFVGMEPVTYKVNGDKAILIEMAFASGNLNEVVVTGYQAQKKADLTGAVSVVNVSDIKDIPEGSATRALQGRIPGVYISSDGSPEGGTTVRIRGVGTLNNNDPLYVIDGIPTTRGLEEINQDDIESMQVLKDAASASIYGSRAANGVIIVTTKKGKNGVSRIDVNASSSLQYYNSKLHMLNTQQHGLAYFRAAINDGSDPNNNQIYQYDWNKDYSNPVLNNIILPEYIDAAKTMKPANTNWFDQIGETSLLQNYNVSFSNGSEKGTSFLSVGYYDNKGIVKQSHTQKATVRLNTDFNYFGNRLHIGENLNLTALKDKLLPIDQIMFTALVQNPIVPVYTLDGGWGGPAPGMTDRQNPVRLIYDNSQNNGYFGRVTGNVFAELTIIPGLKFKTSYGLDYDGTFDRTLRKSYASGFLADPSNLVNESQNYDGNLIWNNTLSYDWTHGKHSLNILAGHESINYVNQYFSGSRQGYTLEDINYSYLDAGSSNILNSGYGGSYSLVSFFGKANYVYNDRYLASVTIRRDGSSRFGHNNQYGTFPSASVGWRISREDFLKDSKTVSDLKLRYSYGETGNQGISNFYAPYTLYKAIYGTDPTFTADQGTAYDISGKGSGTLPSGFVKVQEGNPNIKWETTKESNFGVDFGLLDQKITGSVDYFIRNTTGILITPGYLAAIGEGGYETFNGGSMRNVGIEALLSYSGKLSNDWSFNITGNIATYRNKVTSLPSDVLTAYPGNGTTQTILGHSINSLFGWETQGLFTSQNEVTNSAAQPGKGLGRIRYKDLNGDNVIDANDRTFISNGDPDFTYGLNISVKYKGFNLTAFFQGVQGIQVYNSYKTYTDFTSLWPGTNWGTRVLNAWSPQNTKSSIPALTLVDNNTEGRESSYFLENGSYMKLRNLQLGYDLGNLLKGVKVKSARIYLQGSNLFTIKSKSYTASDPENPGGAFPIPTITSLGIDLTF